MSTQPPARPLSGEFTTRSANTIMSRAESGAFAIFSSCLRYRYQLWYPTGVVTSRVALGVFANPSTATAETTDATIRRWITYCHDWNYGWAGVVNVRAWRETNPKLVPPDPQALGEENDHHILESCKAADLVVCGWGNLGGPRSSHVLDVIRGAGKVAHALKLNKNGSPCHPLRLAANLRPIPVTGGTP